MVEPDSKLAARLPEILREASRLPTQPCGIARRLVQNLSGQGVSPR